jgi:NAD(P)-dependent dehydrogenase (short-subunit alcohol dehydrogenase family)
VHVLITGCSSGFGLETAIAFARRGHDVVATMRDLSRRDALDAAAAAANVHVEVARLDVTDAASVERAVADASRSAPIDVLVNNAGFQIWAPIEEVSDDDIARQFETNVAGLLRVTRAVLPGMRERRSGVIVNLSSVVGMTGSPFEGLYSATKHAVEALSESLYFEVRPFGVRIVIVQPGGYPTAFATNAVRGARFDPDRSPYADGFARWGETLSRMDGHVSADPRVVADTIVTAATTSSPHLYWPIGAEAELVDGLRRPVPFEEYEQALRGALDWWA